MIIEIASPMGRWINLCDLEPEDIRIEDIANALSKLCRFGGQTKEFYSVAQHSVRVAEFLPPSLRLQGLLHDAAEAYVVDLPRPIKQVMPKYRELEDAVFSVIAEKFGIPETLDPAIKYADDVALFTEFEEVAYVQPPPDWFDHIKDRLAPMKGALYPDDAKTLFLDAFEAYTR